MRSQKRLTCWLLAQSIVTVEYPNDENKNGYKKLFKKQTSGKRIQPAQDKTNDADYQLRLDAGESIDGEKNVYLQVNTEAKNDVLKKFKKKHGAHANLATGVIDENTPEADQKEVAKEFWSGLKEEAKGNFK
ncbi:hypothetical protein EJ08DRAFT_661522 [Tothia fuscella]|uniref:Uncharacterized protein n=1 Tax=Tothia fuscella TaxID=1048955 RepID=A0A9P4NQH0_9PEZI|nr:hypothetical protein EJ08DRAFT_661522 [Tothia fuscella]